MTQIDDMGTLAGQHLAKPSTFAIEDCYWGYMIRAGTGSRVGMSLGQVAAFFFGACFATAALGILVLPTLFFEGNFTAMRVGSAGLTGAVAAYLLWFASRGRQTEVHVDTRVGEIREAICNRAGKPTTVAVYPFETVSGVFIAQGEGNDLAQLAIDCGDAEQAVWVAEATEAQLVPLRDRLAQDFLWHAQSGQGKPLSTKQK